MSYEVRVRIPETEGGGVSRSRREGQIGSGIEYDGEVGHEN